MTPGLPSRDYYTLKLNDKVKNNRFDYKMCNTCNIIVPQSLIIEHCEDCNICIEGII